MHPDQGWTHEEETTMKEPTRYSGLTEIGDEIKGLFGTLDDLEKRLAPILENYPNETKEADIAPAPSSALRGHAQGIAQARRRITGLMSRLDLP